MEASALESDYRARLHGKGKTAREGKWNYSSSRINGWKLAGILAKMCWFYFISISYFLRNTLLDSGLLIAHRTLGRRASLMFIASNISIHSLTHFDSMHLHINIFAESSFFPSAFFFFRFAVIFGSFHRSFRSHRSILLSFCFAMRQNATE